MLTVGSAVDTTKQKGRDLKRRLMELLASTDLNPALDELCRLPARQVINPLFSFLSATDPVVRWRAVTAMGVVVARLAAKDMEGARVIMRRLMWSLNDESGGIGWGAPEAMAEIMARHDGLAREYAHILVSYVRLDGNFLEHELLQRGAVWALGRLAQARPDLIQNCIPHLLPYLESKDDTVRGLAVWTMGLLRAETARSLLESLLADNAEIALYLDNELTVRRVSDLAGQALSALGAQC
ncbi:MAG: HEAT repeat domain-containing protein [Thermodesulfobacteriota bacterium]|nr:HEAT repeat domain-containing protein [Thermodesulfobacteriota bacterium]